MPTATGQTPATTRQPPADGLSQGVRRPRGEKPHSSAAPTGATSLEKRSHENQRHAPWDPAATAFLGCAAPKVQVEGKHGSREVRAPLHRTASAFLIAGASGPRRVGEKGLHRVSEAAGEPATQPLPGRAHSTQADHRALLGPVGRPGRGGRQTGTGCPFLPSCVQAKSCPELERESFGCERLPP